METNFEHQRIKWLNEQPDIYPVCLQLRKFNLEVRFSDYGFLSTRSEFSYFTNAASTDPNISCAPEKGLVILYPDSIAASNLRNAQQVNTSR